MVALAKMVSRTVEVFHPVAQGFSPVIESDAGQRGETICRPAGRSPAAGLNA
jgi:hypothetical protein